MNKILTAGLIVLLTAANVSPSLAKSRKVRHPGYAQSHGLMMGAGAARAFGSTESLGFAPGRGFAPGFESSHCAPHYDSAGLPDSCL